MKIFLIIFFVSSVISQTIESTWLNEYRSGQIKYSMEALEKLREKHDDEKMEYLDAKSRILYTDECKALDTLKHSESQPKILMDYIEYEPPRSLENVLKNENFRNLIIYSEITTIKELISLINGGECNPDVVSKWESGHPGHNYVEAFFGQRGGIFKIYMDYRKRIYNLSNGLNEICKIDKTKPTRKLAELIQRLKKGEYPSCSDYKKLDRIRTTIRLKKPIYDILTAKPSYEDVFPGINAQALSSLTNMELPTNMYFINEKINSCGVKLNNPLKQPIMAKLPKFTMFYELLREELRNNESGTLHSTEKMIETYC